MSNHLCYIYIYEYKNLKNLELSIDPSYSYSYDIKNNILTISSQDKLPKNFWGDGIHSLTGIFGDNGAGKSNSIRFILNAVVDGNGNAENDMNGIIVYEDDGKLCVFYHNKREEKNRFRANSPENDLSELIQEVQELPRIETFYYSGFFTPEFNYDDLTTVELGGSYNASIGCRFRNDIIKFANTTDDYKILPISAYIVSHRAQNNCRICNLLIEEGLKKQIKDFKFPRYIWFAPNRGGQDHFKYHPIVNEEIKNAVKEFLTEPIGKYYNDVKNENIAKFIHHCLLNVLADNSVSDLSIINILREWKKTLNTKEDILPQFQEFIKNRTVDLQESLQKIYNVLDLLYKVVHTNYIGAFYLDTENDRDQIIELINMAYNTNIYLTSRYFDMYYSHDKDILTFLSSGEQLMLNLFSLLFDAFKPRHEYEDLSSSQLIILDEAEIGLHPSWQRNFINTLISFLELIKKTNKNTNVDFQIILTSHSPILLSDIPSCCCNYLQVQGSKTVNVTKTQSETFSSNIFELYRNSFFLKDGLIGLFAQEKLKELENNIKQESEDVDKIMNLIGDKRLRHYFEDLRLNNIYDKNKLIEIYKKRIQQLEENLKNEQN